jgi:transposase InsO family protein
MATAPNWVWSWDITKLLGPQKWTYFYLYVLIDIFSRYVVGWLLAEGESAALARKLIGETCESRRSSRAARRSRRPRHVDDVEVARPAPR